MTISKWMMSLILLTVPGAGATAGSAQAADDTTALQSLMAGEAAAWNQGDAKAFGQRYLEDGSFTNIIGDRLYGRDAFVKQHAMIFASIYKGSHLAYTVARIKFVRPDVAIMDVEARLSAIRACRRASGRRAMERFTPNFSSC